MAALAGVISLDIKPAPKCIQWMLTDTRTIPTKGVRFSAGSRGLRQGARQGGACAFSQARCRSTRPQLCQ